MILDEVYREVQAQPVRFGDIMDSLLVGLMDARSRSSKAEWREFARRAQQHPINDLVRQDPYSRRAFEKPRGYAGDAVMLDYLYGYRRSEGLTEIGAAIHDYLMSRPIVQAAHWRRDQLSAAVDEVGGCRESPRVLAMACGHLREAHVSEAVQSHGLADYIALDQDARSLSEVESNFAEHGVRTVKCSVWDLSSEGNGLGLGKFDLIYATGLYCYLWQGAAMELTCTVFDMLRPGGRLLLSNLLPGVPEAGYAEALLDWWLVYRSEERLAAVASGLQSAAVASQRTFADPSGTFGFLEVVRR